MSFSHKPLTRSSVLEDHEQPGEVAAARSVPELFHHESGPEVEQPGHTLTLPAEDNAAGGDSVSMEPDQLEHPHAGAKKKTKQTVVQAVCMKNQEELLIPQDRPDPVLSQQQMLLEDAASSAYTSTSTINFTSQGRLHPVASQRPRALSVWSLPSANAVTAAASTAAPSSFMQNAPAATMPFSSYNSRTPLTMVGGPTAQFGQPREPQVKLPVFKGNSERKGFWLQFQRASRQYGWDLDTILDHLVASLRDDALDFYAELPVQLQVDLRQTVAALERRFGDNKLPETYRASLQTLKKQTKETFEEYAARVQRSVAKAYPGIVGTTLLEDMTIENLVSGLSDTNLVYDVLTKKPKSVQEAVDLIQWHESCHIAQRRRAGVRQVSQWDDPGSQGNSDLSIMRVGGKKFVDEDRLIQFGRDLTEQLAKKLKGGFNRRPQRNNHWKSSVECYACHEYGHIARECPKRTEINDSEETTPESHTAGGAEASN